MPPIKDPITAPTLTAVLDVDVFVLVLGCIVVVDDEGSGAGDEEMGGEGSKDDVQIYSWLLLMLSNNISLSVSCV